MTITRQGADSFFLLAAKSGLKRFDARGQFRELGVPSVSFFEFSNLSRWRSPDRLSASNRFAGGNPCLCAGNGLILEPAVVCDTDLPADDDMTANHTGA